jgi:hypothetical protein
VNRRDRGSPSHLISRTWIDEPLDEIPDEKEQAGLDKLFGRWGDRLWCGLSLRDLVKAIENEWAAEHNRVELWEFFVVVHADNNETLHTSAISLASGVISDSATDFEVDAGPSLHQVEQALFGSLWSYTHLLSVAADHFAIEGRDRLDTAFASSRAAFDSVDPQARETGRNDPCPCGSGKKFKRCHGR